MAEKKYDLLLGPKRNSNAKVIPQPWYRERLIPRCKNDTRPRLDAGSWTFLRTGLDDFRNGKPVTLDESNLMKNSSQLFPKGNPISSVTGSVCGQETSQPGLKDWFTKHEIIYSKTIPNKDKRRRRVEEIEKDFHSKAEDSYVDLGMKEFPEEALTLRGFKKVPRASIDPSYSRRNTKSCFVDPRNPLEVRRNSLTNIDEDEENSALRRSPHGTPEPISGYARAIRNVFKVDKSKLSVISEEPQKDEKLSRSSQRTRSGRRKTLTNQLNSVKLLPKIDRVTKDFCDWIKSLGGEMHNIEEETVKSLFDSGSDETDHIEAKPICVDEMTNLPPEVSIKKSAPLTIEFNDISQERYVPSWQRLKYGAWYLEPKTWKARPANEPLQDPAEVAHDENEELNEELKDNLSKSYGVQSFKKYLKKKPGARRPGYLELNPANPSDEVEAKRERFRNGLTECGE